MCAIGWSGMVTCRMRKGGSELNDNRMIYLTILLAVALGCNGEVAPTPPCALECPNGPTDLEACKCGKCPDGTVWNGLSCEVVDPPPPPPPPGPPTTDYLTLGRAQNELQYQNSQWQGLEFELQANIWQGARDPAVVANHCAWSTQPFFGKSTKQMRDFSDVGHALNEEGERLLGRLPLINWRCEGKPAKNIPPDERFCGRSEVRRAVWGDFKSAYLAHRDESSGMRDAVQMSLCPALAEYASWDSIAGWCRFMNEFELRSCQ